MSRTATVSTVAALSFALAACGGAATQNNTAGDNMTTANEVDANAIDNGAMMNDANMANMSNATDMAAMPTDAIGFATKAAASDLFEITSSKIAQTQAQDAKVKSFASMLVQDHTKSTNELKAIAAANNMTLPPPTLEPAMQSKVDALKDSKGADFDRLYLSQQIPAHEQALALHKGYAQNGDNTKLKDFASKTSVVVSKHLDEVRNLSR
jgi:putative membrane protein